MKLFFSHNGTTRKAAQLILCGDVKEVGRVTLFKVTVFEATPAQGKEDKLFAEIAGRDKRRQFTEDCETAAQALVQAATMVVSTEGGHAARPSKRSRNRKARG
jgi:hypothetical protein